MHNIEPIIYALLITVYMFIGYPFTMWLHENWQWLENASANNDLLLAVFHVCWIPLFMFLVFIRVYELITESRAKDWRQNELD